jgi:urease accessory protein
VASSCSPVSDAGWQARLELDFARHGERTVLARRRHVGPLAVQRPFYPDGPGERGGACHVYLLHPPGGVVGGDALDIIVNAGAGSRALVTTPAAGKLYRSAGACARLSQRLVVDEDAQLEWLPQPTIAFAGVNARVGTRVDLAPGGRFIGWEIVCLGRTDSGERYTGQLHLSLELWRDGATLWVERARYQDDELLAAPHGLRGCSVNGTLLASPAPAADVLAAVRAAMDAHRAVLTGASTVDDVLALRVLGPQAEAVQRALVDAWALLRPAILDGPALAPRIWAT